MRMASLRTFKLPLLLEREQLKALRGPDSELQIWGFLSLKLKIRSKGEHRPRTLEDFSAIKYENMDKDLTQSISWTWRGAQPTPKTSSSLPRPMTEPREDGEVENEQIARMKSTFN